MDERDIAQRLGPDSIRFERLLPGPIERVWAYLTESDKRAQWLAGGDMPLQAGASFILHFDHAGLSPRTASTPERFRAFEGGCTTQHRVLDYAPPHRLVLSWGGGNEPPSEVTFELETVGSRVRLVLTHTKLDTPNTRLDVTSGWHTHLTILQALLESRTPPPFWPLFESLEEEYRWHITSPRT